MTVPWIQLVVAGFFEVGFATCLGKARTSSGQEPLWWMVGFFVCLALSMYLLYAATRTLPIGTAYAVWTGIGAAGTVVIGIVLFKEPTDLWRMVFLFTLIASIIGLKAFSR